MYTPLIRLLLGLVGLAITYFYYQRGSVIAVYLTLFAVFLVVWGYCKNGTVFLAWRKIKKQDFDGAEKIIHQTRFPELLKRGQRGFYHFILGLAEANKNHPEEAQKHFASALVFGVRTENNIAIINLNLAEIEVDRGNIDQAKIYVQITQGLKYNRDLNLK